MTETDTATSTAIRTYTVIGMSCGHCVTSVEEEVAQVARVEAVEVDLNTGRLEIRGGDFSDEQIQAAIEEAGYQLANDR